MAMGRRDKSSFLPASLTFPYIHFPKLPSILAISVSFPPASLSFLPSPTTPNFLLSSYPLFSSPLLLYPLLPSPSPKYLSFFLTTSSSTSIFPKLYSLLAPSNPILPPLPSPRLTELSSNLDLTGRTHYISFCLSFTQCSSCCLHGNRDLFTFSPSVGV